MMKPIHERDKIYRRLLMFAKILAFFGLSGCALPPVKGEKGALRKKAKQDEVAIFFVGNSYSFGVPSAFKKVARANGKKVRIGHSTYSGWSLAKHSKHSPTLKKLREGGWDIVVIQDYSKNPARNELARRQSMDPGIQFFATEARAVGAIPVLYQTWGRRDGDPDVAGDDFLKMNERVRNGYESAAERGGGIAIVRAGDAWEREFREGRGNDLFYEDGSHPSDFGNEVTAQTFYDTIFKR